MLGNSTYRQPGSSKRLLKNESGLSRVAAHFGFGFRQFGKCPLKRVTGSPAEDLLPQANLQLLAEETVISLVRQEEKACAESRQLSPWKVSPITGQCSLQPEQTKSGRHCRRTLRNSFSVRPFQHFLPLESKESVPGQELSLSLRAGNQTLHLWLTCHSVRASDLHDHESPVPSPLRSEMHQHPPYAGDGCVALFASASV